MHRNEYLNAKYKKRKTNKLNFTISQKILNRRHKELNTFMMPHAASCLGTMWVVLLTTAVGSLLTSMAECEGSRVDEREFFLFCTHDLIQHLQHQGLRPMDFCISLQVYIHDDRSFNLPTLAEAGGHPQDRDQPPPGHRLRQHYQVHISSASFIAFCSQL